MRVNISDHKVKWDPVRRFEDAPPEHVVTVPKRCNRRCPNLCTPYLSNNIQRLAIVVQVVVHTQVSHLAIGRVRTIPHNMYMETNNTIGKKPGAWPTRAAPM